MGPLLPAIIFSIGGGPQTRTFTFASSDGGGSFALSRSSLASDEALAFLSDALPAIDVAVLREALEQAGGRAEAVLELFAA